MIAELIRPIVEKRWTLANPPQEIIDLLGGGRTHAGELMSPSRAMSLPGYIAAIRNIAEDVGKLPLKIYRRMPSGGKTELPNHPVYSLLHDMPNPDMTAMTFRETLTQWALGWGNGYAWIQEAASGEPMALWPMSPNRTSPRLRNDGTLYYEYLNETGGTDIYQSKDVLHIHGLGWDGYEGYSVATLAREALGLAMAQQTAGAAFFGNGSMPGGIAEYPGKLDDEAFLKWRERWNAVHGGPSNVNKLAIFEHGMTYKPLSIPNKDAQWIEARRFSIEDAARLFRIPPHKLQDLTRATFSNITEQNIEYVTDTLLAWLVRWEQEIRRKLFKPQERGVFAEHVLDGLLRGAPKERNEAYQIMRRNGVLSANDWRQKENMNPIGPEGDVYIVEQNMVALERLTMEPEPEEPAPPPEGEPEEPLDAESVRKIIQAETRYRRGGLSQTELLKAVGEGHEELFRQAYRRILKVETDKLIRLKARHNGWLDQFYEEHVLHVVGALSSAVDVLCAVVVRLFDVMDNKTTIDRMAHNCTRQMAERHIFWSKDELRKSGTDEEGIKRACAAWLNEEPLETSRVGRMARREISSLLNVLADAL